MSRASEAALDALHAAVAEVLSKGLSGEAPPTPQMIAQAIKFLAVNGITAPAGSKRMSGLEQALADLDLDEIEGQSLQ